MSPDVSPLYLGAEDVIELAELLELLGDWLDHAPRALGDAPVSFCGPGHALGELRTDLARFAFLLDGRAAHRAFGEE